MKLRCSRAVVDRTIDLLQEAGSVGTERAVLWLAHRATDPALVVEAYLPKQKAELDLFIIPREGMTEMMRHLREGRLSLVAQVHSHPGRAYHSRTDDREAIVRHEGSLSVVAPNFARSLTAQSFAEHCAFFTLTAEDRWIEIPLGERAAYFEVV